MEVHWQRNQHRPRRRGAVFAESASEMEQSSPVIGFLTQAPPLSADEVPAFIEEPASVVQKLGGSVTLRCSARPASAHISWRLDGEELRLADGEDGEGGAVRRPDGLFIAALSNRTVGRYQCVASTAAGALASVAANVTAASE